MIRLLASWMMVVFLVVCGCSSDDGEDSKDIVTDLTQDVSNVDAHTGLDVVDSDIGADEESDIPVAVDPIVLPAEPLTPSIFTADLGTASEGIAFGPDGLMYLSSSDGRIYRLHADATMEVYVDLLPLADGVGTGNAGIAFGPDGALYVCRYEGDRIEKVTLGDTPTVEEFASVENPNSVLFDSQGRLWFTSSNSNGGPGFVGRFDDDAVVVVVPEVVYANGLAFSPDEFTLYFTSTDPGSVWKIAVDADGNTVGDPEMIADGDDCAVSDGLLMGRDGTLFIAGFGSAKVLAYQNGALCTVAEIPGGMELVGVASMAWGEGEFNAGSIYATNLMAPRIVEIVIE